MDWKLGGFEFLIGTAELDEGYVNNLKELLPKKYQSPELARGNQALKQIPVAADWWALGYTLFEIFCGPIRSPADLKNIQTMPEALRPDYMRLLRYGGEPEPATACPISRSSGARRWRAPDALSGWQRQPRGAAAADRDVAEPSVRRGVRLSAALSRGVRPPAAPTAWPPRRRRCGRGAGLLSGGAPCCRSHGRVLRGRRRLNVNAVDRFFGKLADRVPSLPKPAAQWKAPPPPRLPAMTVRCLPHAYRPGAARPRQPLEYGGGRPRRSSPCSRSRRCSTRTRCRSRWCPPVKLFANTDRTPRRRLRPSTTSRWGRCLSRT